MWERTGRLVITVNTMKTYCWLVVGPPLWKRLECVNWDDRDSQYFWENAKLMATIHHQPLIGTHEHYLVSFMDLYLFDLRDHPLYNVTTGKNMSLTEKRRSSESCVASLVPGFLSMVNGWPKKTTILWWLWWLWDQQMGSNMTFGPNDM